MCLLSVCFTGLSISRPRCTRTLGKNPACHQTTAPPPPLTIHSVPLGFHSPSVTPLRTLEGARSSRPNSSPVQSPPAYSALLLLSIPYLAQNNPSPFPSARSLVRSFPSLVSFPTTLRRNPPLDNRSCRSSQEIKKKQDDRETTTTTTAATRPPPPLHCNPLPSSCSECPRGRWPVPPLNRSSRHDTAQPSFLLALPLHQTPSRHSLAQSPALDSTAYIPTALFSPFTGSVFGHSGPVWRTPRSDRASRPPISKT